MSKVTPYTSSCAHWTFKSSRIQWTILLLSEFRLSPRLRVGDVNIYIFANRATAWCIARIYIYIVSHAMREKKFADRWDLEVVRAHAANSPVCCLYWKRTALRKNEEVRAFIGQVIMMCGDFLQLNIVRLKSLALFAFHNYSITIHYNDFI